MCKNVYNFGLFVRYNPTKAKKHLERCILTNGAASKNRTYDPTLTKGVLYH